MTIVLFIFGLLLFVGLVVVHEWGHFIMARRNGVDIEEFGIGFPPRIWKKRIKSEKGDYNFTINLLPLGGFVKLKGEHDTDTGPGTFGAASVSAKTKIMAAGVAMNLVVAFLLLTLLAAVGIPKLIDNQYTVSGDTKVVRNQIIIGFVEPNSPASKAGIKQADHLVGFIGTQRLCQFDQLPSGTPATACIAPYLSGESWKVKSAKDLSAFTKTHAGQKVGIIISRDGHEYYTQATIRSTKEVDASQNTKEPKGYLGVGPTDFTIQRSTWSSPVVAAGLIGQFTKLTFQGLGSAVVGLGKIIAGAVTGNSVARVHGQTQASEQVSGPLGIFIILKDGSALGINFVLLIIAIISLTLAIMNILPIPMLDGGRLWLTLATRAVHRPLSPEKEELINASGFVFLMLLIVVITIVDIRRFF
jgi:regulator of sigma E protease